MWKCLTIGQRCIIGALILPFYACYRPYFSFRGISIVCRIVFAINKRKHDHPNRKQLLFSITYFFSIAIMSCLCVKYSHILHVRLLNENSKLRELLGSVTTPNYRGTLARQWHSWKHILYLLEQSQISVPKKRINIGT